MGELGHAHFGITHRRSTIAIDRTKVPLPIDQQITQAKWLRHTDDGIVDSSIAMRVIFTDHITDHTGRFFIGFVIVIPELMHGIEHTTMNRF